MAEVIQLPFARGIDEGADPKQLPPGVPLVHENRFFDKAGRSRKRYGTTALATSIIGGGNISAGKRIVTRGKDLGVIDGTHLYAYNADLAKWRKVARVPPLHSTYRGLVNSTRGMGAVSVALSGSMLVTVYEANAGTTGSDIFCKVEDVDTGAIIMPPTFVTTGAFSPRVVIGATHAHIVFGYSGTIAAITLGLTSLGLGTETNIDTGAYAGTYALDAVIATADDGERLYMLYPLAAGADKGRIRSVLTSTYGTAESVEFAGTLLTSFNAAGLAQGSGKIHAVYSGVAGVGSYLVTVTTDLAGMVGPTAMFGGGRSRGMFVEVDDSTNVLVGVVKDDGSLTNTAADRLNTGLFSIAAHVAVSTSDRITYHVRRVSKPWRIGSRWYVYGIVQPRALSLVSTDTLPAASTVILEIETADSIATEDGTPHLHVGTLETQIGWYSSRQGYTPSVAVSGDVAYVPAAFRTVEIAGETPLALGWNLHRISLSAGDLYRSAVVGQCAIVSASAPFWYDGASAAPYGFAFAPYIYSVSAAAGGAVVAGTYLYQFLYEWRDASGLLHRSPPSASKSGTTATTNLTLDSIVSTSTVSSKEDGDHNSGADAAPVSCVAFRSTINGADLYRITREPLYQVRLNDALAASVTLSDVRADASITGSAPAIALSTQEQMYTVDGDLDAVMPPSSVSVLTHRERIWLLAGDEHTVWATTAVTDDPTVAPSFNEALTTYFSARKTALGKLDESVVVLGPDSIDIIAGEGPDATGNGRWSVRGVQTDLGCNEPRSLATIPPGLIFQSERGIMMLTRELTVAWIGEQVKDTLTTYPTITSAVVIPAQHQVRFTCNTAALDDGVVLVFDYARAAWSVFDYGFPIADAALVDDVYTFLRYTGAVFRENTATHLDSGTTYVVGAVELPLAPSGPNAWHRLKDVQLLGTAVTNHQITFKVQRDYATSYEQTKTFAASGDVTTISPLEKARITLARQKGQHFKIRIEDAAPGGNIAVSTGEGAILSGLALFVQRKEGLPKASSGRKG